MICVFLSFESTAKEVNFNNLVKREGIWFEKFSDNPYSGDVVGKEKGKMIKGQKTGEWNSFFGGANNNDFRVKENYKKGKLHGKKLEFINRTGKLFVKEFYKKGKLIESYEYHDNGEISEHKKYIKGNPIHYKYTYYFKNGQIARKGSFNGKDDGKYFEYYENGTLHYKQNYNKGLIVDDEVEYFCWDGTRYQKEIIVDGKINGEVKVYRCPDQYLSAEQIEERLDSKGNYKNGKKVGVHTSYFYTGEVKEIINYNNDGVKNGESVRYFRNLENVIRLRYKQNFIPCPDNKLIACRHGKSFFYNQDGQLKSKLNFKFDKLDGEFENYYKDGKIKSKGDYKNGEKIGNWVEYNELGEIIKNEQYD